MECIEKFFINFDEVQLRNMECIENFFINFD